MPTAPVTVRNVVGHKMVLAIPGISDDGEIVCPRLKAGVPSR